MSVELFVHSVSITEHLLCATNYGSLKLKDINQDSRTLTLTNGASQGRDIYTAKSNSRQS